MSEKSKKRKIKDENLKIITNDSQDQEINNNNNFLNSEKIVNRFDNQYSKFITNKKEDNEIEKIAQYILNEEYNNYNPIEVLNTYSNQPKIKSPEKMQGIILPSKKNEIINFNDNISIEMTMDDNKDYKEYNKNSKNMTRTPDKKSIRKPFTTRKKSVGDIKTTKANYLRFINKGALPNTIKMYKEKIESDKEKRLYEEKIKIIKNRINMLKNQEAELNKKINSNNEKSKMFKNVKKERNKIKSELMAVNNEFNTEIENKKKEITDLNFLKTKYLKEKKENFINEKAKKYKETKMESIKLKNIQYEQNLINDMNNKNLIKKIKTERDEYQNSKIMSNKKNLDNLNIQYNFTIQNNLRQTKKLQNELSKLESLEKTCLFELKKTRCNLMNSEKCLFKNKRKLKRARNSASNLIGKFILEEDE